MTEAITAARQIGGDEVADGFELAPVLGARRDGTAGADSSRALLMTVLGELMLAHGGCAWTQTLVEMMDPLDVRDKAARQAIARMHERGWLDKERIGRQTRWTLTRRAVDLLTAGAERIYGFGAHRRAWDGSWLVLLASVPERDRTSRYRMGRGLSWAGFGSLGQGTWISPWVDREEVAVSLVGELGIEATSFRAELGRLGSAEAIVAQAWDLPSLRAEYDDFLDTTGPGGAASAEPADPAEPAEPADGRTAAAELVDVVHRWRRFPFLDPDLPAELLPADWPGAAAAARFAERRTALAGPASRWWHDLETRYTSM